jgi:PAS domain-containing protein
MDPFAGTDGGRLPPQLAGVGARPVRPVDPPAPLRRVEPLAAVFLGLHGLVVLAGLDADPWQWAAVALVLAAGLAGLGGRGPAWTVTARAWAILVVGVALQASAGGAGGWFLAWPFVLVAVYPLALPGPGGTVVAGLAVLAYVLVVRLVGPAVGPALAVARGALLAGLAALAWAVARAYARMATVATEASLELARRERQGQALLDALPDPAAVLDAQGLIVQVNQAWKLPAAERRPGLALGEPGESYPAACAAAADAGYRGLEPAAEGVRAVLEGEVSAFSCRYLVPGDAGAGELNVRPLAGGDGAVVTLREPLR